MHFWDFSVIPIWVSVYCLSFAGFLQRLTCNVCSLLESQGLLFACSLRFLYWYSVCTGMWELTAAEWCACLSGWAVLWPWVQDSTGLNSAPRQYMLRREYQHNADTCPGRLVYHWQSADTCQQEQHLACNPEHTEERWRSWHTAATEVSGGLTCSELGHVAFCHIKQHISCVV